MGVSSRHTACSLFNQSLMLDKKYIIAIRTGISKKGYKDKEGMKEELVSQYTYGRTTSVRAMKTVEALELISYLSSGQKEARKKMMRKVYALAYEMNITCIVDRQRKVDTKRLDNLINQLSPQKKGLQKHNNKELRTLISVLEKYYRQELKKGSFV